MQLTDIISGERLHNIKRKQYPDKVILSGIVSAGKQQVFNVSISSIGDFFSTYITARYTTLTLDGSDIVDNGVCPLRVLLIDGTGSRKLCNDHIPLDLIASCGRVKSATAVNTYQDYGNNLRADAGNNLFYPFEFQYLFDNKSSIIADIKNDATADNRFDIVFHGIRIL